MSRTLRSLRAGVLLLGAVGCGSEPPAQAGSARQPPFSVQGNAVRIHEAGPIAFDVVEVQRGQALPLPSVTARVTTVESLTSPSFAPLSGRVVEAQVHLGDHVRVGQRLVLVRSAEMPTFEREMRSAELAVKTRLASVERMRALVAARAGSQNDLLLAESELQEARLAQRAARARLSSLEVARGRDESGYWVLATRSGTVVQLEATPGMQVGPDRGPVATVADLSEVLAVADVTQRDAVSVKRGSVAQVRTAGAATAAVDGIVEFVSEVVDPERQTVPVRIRIRNRERQMRPNAYVDVTFAATAADALAILPLAAVVRDGPTAIVFVQRPDGTLVRRPVVLGKRSREEVEVLSGLDLGERVVTTGALLLLNALDVEA